MNTMTDTPHLTMEELEAGLEKICQSPKDNGVLKLLVRRPREGDREILSQGELCLIHGLMGDNWKSRGSTKTPDGSAYPDSQLNIMNFRAIALVARTEERRPLAGDQLYLDLDLSDENLAPGTRLSLGSAIIEVTAEPHTGCKKFLARFGPQALKFVNSPVGRKLNLRGINAKVIEPGVIRVGDVVRKLSSNPSQ